MFPRLSTVTSWRAEGNVSLFWLWDIRFCGFWTDWKRGQCVFPLAVCLSAFYSKADCTVSGCLYTISIIMEEEGASPPRLPHVWRHLSASQSVSVSFFFGSFITQPGCFSPGVFRYRRGHFVFDCPIHLPDSFVPTAVGGWGGGLVTSDVCTYIVKFVTVDWCHAVCVCNPSWLQPVTRVLQEEMAECGCDSLPSHVEFCPGL